MSSSSHSLRIWLSRAIAILREDGASQMVEFAVSLPLLVVIVVGIFDFSGAYTLKQKLASAARDAARTAAADPTSDLTMAGTPVPASISDAFQVVENYLSSNKLSDCGVINTVAPVGLTWTFTATVGGASPCSITLIINRGYYFPQSATAVSKTCTSQTPNALTTVIGTCVSLQYSYQWRFGQVIGLLGGSSVLPATLSTTAVALNEN